MFSTKQIIALFEIIEIIQVHSCFQKSFTKKNGNRTCGAESESIPRPDHEHEETEKERALRILEEKDRKARMTRLKLAREELKEIELEQEKRLKELEKVRKRMEEDLERRKAEVRKYKRANPQQQ